jgi:hypothetical protein
LAGIGAFSSLLLQQAGFGVSALWLFSISSLARRTKLAAAREPVYRRSLRHVLNIDLDALYTLAADETMPIFRGNVAATGSAVTVGPGSSRSSAVMSGTRL